MCGIDDAEQVLVFGVLQLIEAERRVSQLDCSNEKSPAWESPHLSARQGIPYQFEQSRLATGRIFRLDRELGEYFETHPLRVHQMAGGKPESDCHQLGCAEYNVAAQLGTDRLKDGADSRY